MSPHDMCLRSTRRGSEGAIICWGMLRRSRQADPVPAFPVNPVGVSAISASSLSSLFATPMMILGRLSEALHWSTDISDAIPQDLACAEGTRGGYWNAEVRSAGAGIASSVQAMLYGSAFQFPSSSNMPPEFPRNSLAHRSISATVGSAALRPWSWNHVATCMKSTFRVSKGNRSRRRFPREKPPRWTRARYKPGTEKRSTHIAYQALLATRVEKTPRRRNGDSSLIHRMTSTSGRWGVADAPASSASVGLRGPELPETRMPNGQLRTGV
jgi:hypothetical protein